MFSNSLNSEFRPLKQVETRLNLITEDDKVTVDY